MSKKNFSRAQELLMQVGNDSDYPFPAAAQLIKALSKGRSADRLAIFTQALNNFEQYGSRGAIFTADFGSVVTSVWELLPSDVVLEASTMLDSSGCS